MSTHVRSSIYTILSEWTNKSDTNVIIFSVHLQRGTQGGWGWTKLGGGGCIYYNVWWTRTDREEITQAIQPLKAERKGKISYILITLKASYLCLVCAKGYDPVINFP